MNPLNRVCSTSAIVLDLHVRIFRISHIMCLDSTHFSDQYSPQEFYQFGIIIEQSTQSMDNGFGATLSQ